MESNMDNRKQTGLDSTTNRDLDSTTDRGLDSFMENGTDDQLLEIEMESRMYADDPASVDNLNKKDDLEINYVSDDQVFGNNNQAVKLPENEDGTVGDNDVETPARRARSIMREADDTRQRLNSQKSEVRNYGLDAREIPM